MDFEITTGFPTSIGRWLVPEADALNRDLRALILAEETSYPSLGRSNIGGWHSRPDFLQRTQPGVATLTTWLTWAVRRMGEATAAGEFTDTVSVSSAWATIWRTGAYDAPHSHPDSSWSGVYYVDAGPRHPDHPLSGVLEFLDPHGDAEIAMAPGHPRGEPVRVRPESGLLVVFPSWLSHWVHPYAGHSPRIAVSFNATAVAADQAIPLTPSFADTRHALERSA